MSASHHKLKKRLGFVSLEAVNHFLKPAFTSLLSLLVIRLSSADVWGSFVPVLIGVELLMNYLNWGQKPYLLRSFSMKSAGLADVWLTAFVSRILLFLPILVFMWFLPLERTVLLLCLLWLFLRFFSQSFEPLIQYERKYSVSILAETLSIVLGCGVVYFSPEINLQSVLYAVLLGQGVKAAVLATLTPKVSFSRDWHHQITEYFTSAFPFLLLGLIGLLQAKIDLYLVTWLMPASDTAFYHVLSGFLVILQTGAFIILAPFVKNIYRMNSSSLYRLKNRYMTLGAAFTLVGALTVVAVLKWLYLFEVDAVLVLLIAAYNFPLFLYLIESQVLLKQERENQLLASTALSAIAGFGACYFLIPQMGIFGALVGGIFARFVIVAMVMFFVKSQTNA